MDNYEKSNSITKIPNLFISQQTRKLYKKYREVTTITQEMLQDLSDSILNDLRINTVKVTLSSRRPHKTNGRCITRQTYGTIKQSIFSSDINIYKYTAAKQQLVSAKSAISTLLHEINHEIDKTILNLNSIHTKGFYMRLAHLISLISSME